MSDEVAKQQLKELEQAREKLARQIETSKEALGRLDEKIASLSKELNDASKS